SEPTVSAGRSEKHEPRWIIPLRSRSADRIRGDRAPQGTVAFSIGRRIPPPLVGRGRRRACAGSAPKCRFADRAAGVVRACRRLHPALSPPPTRGGAIGVF